MLLDATALAVLGLASLVGALAGLIRPAFLALGTCLGWLAARHLSGPLAGPLARVVPGAVAQPLAMVLLFVGVSVAVGIAGRRLARGPGGEGRPTDRAGGALLAGAAAAATLWVVVVVADAAAPVLGEPAQRQLAASDLAGLVRAHDVLAAWRKPAEEALRRLLHAAGDPGTVARLAGDPELRSLVDDARVRSLVEEARGARAGEVVRSPDALRLLDDPGFRARLEAAQRRIDEAGR